MRRTMTVIALAGALATSALHVIPVAAQDAPAARALRDGFTDADLSWVMPLLDAEASDAARRGRVLGHALELEAERQAREAEAWAARAAADPFVQMRERSTAAVAAPRARYQAECSVFLTGVRDVGELVAVFGAGGSTVSSLAAFYESRGFRREAARDALRLRSADGGTVAEIYTDNRLIRASSAGLREDSCAGVPDGPVVTLAQGGGPSLQSRMDGSFSTAQRAEGGERLPAALAAAGLDAASWSDVMAALGVLRMHAQSEADNPGYLSVIFSDQPAAQTARIRAQVAWFTRHRAVLAPRLDALSGGG